MGLWLKQDGKMVEVSGGGGGTFDGEHVPTGDPTDPASLDLVDEGQLLYDGVESDGSGGGPHDHDDYLPLAGGTVTGDLQVDGQIRGPQGTQTAPTYSSVNDPTSGFYFGNFGGKSAAISVAGVYRIHVGENRTRIIDDLLVDGTADLIINAPADAWGRTTRGTVFVPQGMTSGTQGSFGVAMTSNGYRNDDGKWTSLGVNNTTGATTIDLMPTGRFYVRVASNYPTGSASHPSPSFTVTEAGPTFRAQPSKTRSTDEVLERAETAEFPPEDDEGVATMDGHDEVPLFEVVTALLAKVKQLSAEIEELKGN